ncbi:sensor domain-containing diguanylate cyclase [Lentilitoribacter sp. Alg239-R112]|uniref:sensor domain-containing protein n=1 Tax=Lentilitoribacter sp. Alg239-R112 TaxID=2305987 RepID=UPI0013A6E305|nr:sensor domain-containing diguanylate cyclase [Lentilitoribacter sp. Alg239-R112]
MKSLQKIGSLIAADKLLDLVQQPAVLTNDSGAIIYCNQAFDDLFKAQIPDIFNQNITQLIDRKDSDAIIEYLGGTDANSDQELKVNLAENSGNTKLIVKYLTTDDDGNKLFVGLGSIAHSIPNLELINAKANEKRLQMALEHESRHDALTGLANRRKLVEDQDAIFEFASQSDAAPAYAVMRIDLDRFKRVNDNYGHAAGDAVLVHVSEIFTKIVGSKGSVARMGGDEFSILITRERREREILKIAEQIMEEVAKPFSYKGTALQFGVSIGIASSAFQGADPAQTQANAEQALYEAKESGQNCIRFFSERFIDEEEYYGT